MRTQPFFGGNNAQIFIADQQVGLMQAVRIEETFSSYRLKSLWNRTNIAFIPGTEDITFSASRAFIDYQSLLANANFISSLVSSLIVNGGRTTGNLASLPVSIGNAAATLIGGKASKVQTTQVNASLGLPTDTPLSFNSVEDYQILANQQSNVTQLLITAFQGLLNGQFSLGMLFSIADFTIKIRGPASPNMLPVSSNVQNGTAPTGSTNAPSGITEGVTIQGATASVLQEEVGGLIAGGNNTTNIIEVFALRGCRMVTRAVTMTTGNIIVMEEVNGFAKSWQETYEQTVASGVAGAALLSNVPTSS